MTARIENWSDIKELVLMSIGTNKGSWWADPDFGSLLFTLADNGKVDGKTAGNFQHMIKECLAWLVSDGLAESIDCDAERTGRNEISYVIAVTRAQGNGAKTLIIKDVWNAV
ncbi:MAG: hypothetical protein Ta2A_12500 [Treponemataceae bacterium]|nr:MAG: hypothetical protein Ta2A_12500 [Treponemataceae bacterium]